MALAHVPGEKRPTMQAYFSKTGYFPEGTGVLPFDESLTQYHTVEESLHYILNGEVFETHPNAYESQVARTYTEGPTIIKFLTESPQVPENVREFMSIITSEKLSDKIMEKFGPINEGDPEIVNKFFKDSFKKFQTMTIHRYVTDFIRGVESRLIFNLGSFGEKIGRRTIGGWRNFDFSKIPKDTLQKAIQETLKTGEHRIRLLNHEKGINRKTLKDKQEYVEKVLGWNTYDMKFLRWEKFWDLYNTLGGGWHCICFSRKPIFNTGTFQQY